MIIMIILTLIACLSGTRGYILVSVVVTYVSIFLYAGNRLRLMMCLSMLILALSKYHEIIDLVFNKLRMGESTGRRHSENLFVIELMNERPLFNVLFGNGFGSIAGQYSISENIILNVSDSAYTYKVLHYVTGFHNFWGTILYSSGIIGLFLIIVLYVSLLKRIVVSDVDCRFKIVSVAFWVSYAVLLWYRWTAACGVLEFAMFSYVLHDIEHRSVDVPIQIDEQIAKVT